MRSIITALVLLAANLIAAPPAITTVENFETMGFTWPWTLDLSTATTSSVCTVEYSDDAGATWYPALDAWSDGAASQFIGRIFYLDPNTLYSLRLTCDSPAVSTTTTFTTRNDVFPEGTVNQLGAQTTLQTITTASSGTAGAYTVYENGSITSANPGGIEKLMVIEDDVKFLILRNITFTGGTLKCLELGQDTEDIIIENCVFREFGNPGIMDSLYGPNLWNNCAIGADAPSGPALVRSPGQRITIQNCDIKSTVGGSNDYNDFGPVVGAGGVWAFTAVTDEGGGKVGFAIATNSDFTEPLGDDDYAPKRFAVINSVLGEKELSTGYNTQAGDVAGYNNGTWPNLYTVDLVNSTTTKVVADGAFHGTDTGDLQFDFNQHPTGQHAIAFNETVGQHVIRYNKIWATDSDFGYNDAIGGSANNSETAGALGLWTDIHGNEVSFANDNGIEAEGSGRGVAIFHNYLHTHRTALATAAVNQGPLYVFRNVITGSRGDREAVGLSNAVMNKTANTSDGRQYWFSNTVTGDGSERYAQFASNSGGGSVDYWYSRNNIADVANAGAWVDSANASTHDLDADMFRQTLSFATANLDLQYDSKTTPPAGSPPSGYWLGLPTFDASGPFSFVECNADQLDSLSLGYQVGYPLPNIGMDASTRLTISNPDVGALDPRMVAFQFGIQNQITATLQTSGTFTIGP